jgi:hypothetical protein
MDAQPRRRHEESIESAEMAVEMAQGEALVRGEARREGEGNDDRGELRRAERRQQAPVEERTRVVGELRPEL